jgi:hypothetical protein
VDVEGNAVAGRNIGEQQEERVVGGCRDLMMLGVHAEVEDVRLAKTDGALDQRIERSVPPPTSKSRPWYRATASSRSW